ncbi:unnamed protein product [Leptidea sinapis]|uniref:Uncharacterized protein n=1 Tax=Leptidea sinapis TaxID=189913 RepID=A0A5E4QZ92_9NEOP|nr:unnamed protein product [Leptidea sinapis]
MDLHLHLTVAFRALDREWGMPIDLEDSCDVRTCLPVDIDLPKTTFSSEDFFCNIRNQTMCRQRRKESFCDISMPRMPSTSDLGSSCESLYLSGDEIGSDDKVFSNNDDINSSQTKESTLKTRQRRLHNVLNRLKRFVRKF